MPSGPADIDALLRELQSAASAERTESSRERSPLLSKTLSRSRDARERRLKTLGDAANASGLKNAFKARLADLNALQEVEKAGGAVKALFSAAESEARRDELNRERAVAILADIDEGRDAIASGRPPSGSGAFTGDGLVAARHLGLAISATRDAERVRSLGNDLNDRRTQAAFEERASALQSQLSALKTSGWIGKVFRYLGAVVAPLAAVVASVLSPVFGLAAFALRSLLSGLVQNAVNGLFQTSTWLAKRGPSRQSRDAETSLRNAEEFQSALSRRHAEDEAEKSRDDAVRDRTIRHVEQALNGR